MIFVPANRTSDFQPLDRRIFGIMKSKLRSLAGIHIYCEKKKYELIAKDLMKSWEEISPKQLNSAWNLPNLETLVQKIDLEFVIDEFNDTFNQPPNNEDIFEWEVLDSDDYEYKG